MKYVKVNAPDIKIYDDKYCLKNKANICPYFVKNKIVRDGTELNINEGTLHKFHCNFYGSELDVEKIGEKRVMPIICEQCNDNINSDGVSIFDGEMSNGFDYEDLII